MDRRSLSSVLSWRNVLLLLISTRERPALENTLKIILSLITFVLILTKIIVFYIYKLAGLISLWGFGVLGFWVFSFR